ncbi:MAG: gluconate:H+ symporter [Sediminibacterium sp.]
MVALFTILIGLVVMLSLIVWLKLNAFLALFITALVVGLAGQLTIANTLSSIQTGVGSTLGSIAVVISFGAILGKLLESSGAAYRITASLINRFGAKNLSNILIVTGFLIGIPMIYNASFLVLIPLLYSFSIAAKQPLLPLGISMCSSLSVAHALLPPHPGITSVAAIYKADLNVTLLYGLVLAVPAILFSGYFFARFFQRSVATIPKHLYNKDSVSQQNLPSLSSSIIIALLPVVLMLVSVITKSFFPAGSTIAQVVELVSNPSVALLLAVLAGYYFLGVRRGKTMKDLGSLTTLGVTSIGMILMIIAGGGAFKQILIDTGLSKQMGDYTQQFALSPILLAWVTAALLRFALGSATVASITAAGIILPLVNTSKSNPQLMALATASGSLMFSHVNDIGFWMFKEYFNLNLKQTFLSWTVMESIVAIVGLAGCLILNYF